MFGKGPKLSREAMLRSKPVRNDQVEWVQNDDGEIVVTLRRSDTWKIKILAKVFWVPEKRTLVLDEIGSEVWGMCDGRTNVKAMIKRLGDAHQLNAKESEISLLAYLKQLGEKRIMGFVVDKNDMPKNRKKDPSGKAWGN